MIELLTDKRFKVTAFPGRNEKLLIIREPKPLDRCLDYLAGMLENSKWLLGGGVAIPLTLGGFYRQHSDLDILTDLDHFQQVYSLFRQAGYRLYTRKSITFKGRGLLFMIETGPGRLCMQIHPRSLCFINPEMMSSIPRLSKLDLYLYEEKNSKILTSDKKWIVNRTQPMEGFEYNTLSGKSITCLDLHYVRHFKSGRGGLKHRIDIVAIDDGVEAAKIKRRWLRVETRPRNRSRINNPCFPAPSAP